MDRKEVTNFLSELLIQQRFSGRGKYWAREVTLDYGQGQGKVKRVDFMQFKPYKKIKGKKGGKSKETSLYLKYIFSAQGDNKPVYMGACYPFLLVLGVSLLSCDFLFSSAHF